jgi:tetratricopeptide (TPR) repeat protein
MAGFGFGSGHGYFDYEDGGWLLNVRNAWKLPVAVAVLIAAGCGPKVEPPPTEPPEEEPVVTASERLDLAAGLMEMGRVGEATAQYAEVLKDVPDDFEANLNLGIALYTMEDAKFQNERNLTEATAYFEKAASLRASDPRPHLFLGKIDFDGKAYGAAVGHLSTASSLDPANESAHEMLGLALIEVGSREAGKEELKKAIEINPANQAANLALGRVYESEASNTLAMEHLERALAANPNLDMATYLLERVYYEEGLYAKAEERCRQFLNYHPEDIQSLEILGWIYSMQGRTPEMVGIYERLTEIEPENTAYWSPVIQYHMDAGEYGPARRALETALEHNPYYAYGNVRYGQVLMHYAEEAADASRFDEAIRLLSLARDRLGMARVDDRYASASSQLLAQVEDRLRDLTNR